MMNMDEATATNIVRQMQNEYLRGEMSPQEIARLLEINPNAVREWNKLLLKLKIKLKTFTNMAKNILHGGLAKSNGCRRFRPGKEKSTLKKQRQRLSVLDEQFSRAGLTVLMSFNDFMDGVCKTISCTQW